MKLFTTTLIAFILATFTMTASAMGGDDIDVKAKSTADNLSINDNRRIDNSRSNVQGSDLSRMVPSVMAPALTTTLTETCMGSTSVGVGWSGAGFSFGTTWRDSACVRRLDARQISSIHPNFAIAAKELMCDSDAVFAAFKRAGLPCAPRDGYEVAVAEPKK